MQRLIALVCGVLLSASFALAQTSDMPIIRYSDLRHPELGSAGMVASQNALASEVGAQVLADGGNAIDAEGQRAKLARVVEVAEAVWGSP